MFRRLRATFKRIFIPFEKTLKRDTLVIDAGADLIRDTAVSVDFYAKVVGEWIAWSPMGGGLPGKPYLGVAPAAVVSAETPKLSPQTANTHGNMPSRHL